jgi:hypothetical protein
MQFSSVGATKRSGQFLKNFSGLFSLLLFAATISFMGEFYPEGICHGWLELLFWLACK